MKHQETNGKAAPAENTKRTNELLNPTAAAAPAKKRRGRVWTAEQKAVQAAKIRGWKPWKASTGPKTAAGKARSSANSYKHGLRSRPIRAFISMLTVQKHWLAMVVEQVALQKSLANPPDAPYNPALSRIVGGDPSIPKTIWEPYHRPLFKKRPSRKGRPN